MIYDMRPPNIMWRGIDTADKEVGQVELYLIDFEDAIFFNFVIPRQFINILSSLTLIPGTLSLQGTRERCNSQSSYIMISFLRRCLNGRAVILRTFKSSLIYIRLVYYQALKSSHDYAVESDKRRGIGLSGVSYCSLSAV